MYEMLWVSIEVSFQDLIYRASRAVLRQFGWLQTSEKFVSFHVTREAPRDNHLVCLYVLSFHL